MRDAPPGVPPALLLKLAGARGSAICLVMALLGGWPAPEKAPQSTSDGRGQTEEGYVPEPRLGTTPRSAWVKGTDLHSPTLTGRVGRDLGGWHPLSKPCAFSPWVSVSQG